MMFDIEKLKCVVEKAATVIVELEQELNQADAKLGDGDTGSMLTRVLQSLNEAHVSDDVDIGVAFKCYANAAALATGSSLGTLFATALLACSKETKGRQTVPVTELGALLLKARDSMIARGGANLGDKTVLDALDAIAHAIVGIDDKRMLVHAIHRAGDGALAEYLMKPNRVGRARMFAEKTIGLDDPGMLAFVQLSKGVFST